MLAASQPAALVKAEPMCTPCRAKRPSLALFLSPHGNNESKEVLSRNGIKILNEVKLVSKSLVDFD
jgi:hypothetical protein